MVRKPGSASVRSRKVRRAAARGRSAVELLQRSRSGAPSFLSAAQIEAAKRLQRDFERAQLRQRLTRDLAAAIPGHREGGRSPSVHAELAVDAKRRCLEALGAVGPGLADLLFETVCMEHGLVEAERQFGWPTRSAKAIMALALDRLAAHYGMASGTRRAGRIELWRDDLATL